MIAANGVLRHNFLSGLGMAVEHIGLQNTHLCLVMNLQAQIQRQTGRPRQGQGDAQRQAALA
jgi:hypothetical protein